ncbi:caspase family protein, partial [uncultured Muribaculum sp.]
SKSTFAVIIANESYANVPRVEAALNDGETFSKYCNLTLGIPKENIRVYKDATLGKMLRAIADIRNVVKSVDGNADVIFYYAGHGMPDESTKDAFLLPVDGDAMVSESCISLGKLYSDLGDMGANSVMVFLDACFSGGNRSGGMLTAARGVAIKPKQTSPKGNMFTLSAASGQETAMPYKEKNHGLFTYYLLKKLQESKGNVTLKELSDYVIDNVRRQATIVNKKPQTPQVSTSGNMAVEWTKRKIRN